MNWSKSILKIFFLSISSVLFSQEHHLRNIQKLTFGGDNAEAYFSPERR